MYMQILTMEEFFKTHAEKEMNKINSDTLSNCCL